MFFIIFITLFGNFAAATVTPTKVFINEYEVNTALSPQTVTAYDAVAYYTFDVGETAVIECSPQIYGIVRNFYDDADNSSLSIHPLTIKLMKEYDAKYIQCKYEDGLGDVFVTRLIFELQRPDTPQSIIKMEINGMKVNVRPSNNSNFDYSLVYQAGEEIDLVVSIQNAEDSSLLVNYDGIEHFLSHYYKKTLKLKKEDDRKELKILASNTKSTRENLTITFVHHPRILFLTDINKGHILKQYDRGNNSVVVHYEYSDYETISIISSDHLLFHCSSIKAKFTANNTTDSRFPESRKIIVTLERNDNGGTIVCVCYELQYNGQMKILKEIYIKLIYKPVEIIKDERTNSWIPWTIILLIILAIIVILAVIMKKKKKKQCSVSNNVNSPIEFANIYPMDGPEEQRKAELKAERPQEPLPHTIQESNHCHQAESNDPTDYSEVYYEPSFPKRKPSINTENEYVYADCAHLGERHNSPFDAVASMMALEQAKRSNKNVYSNLEELCKPGHCVMRTFVGK